MRFNFFSFLLFITIGIVTSKAQTVENVSAEVGQNGVVTVTYDLKGNPSDERFKIRLYSSHNGYSSPLQQITGDANEDFSIVPGDGKKIMWDAASELGSFNGELAFEVRAEVLRVLRIDRPSTSKAVRRGSKTSIQWTGGKPAENVKIELLKGSTVVSNIGSVSNSGSYQWSVPKEMAKGKDYTIRMTNSSGATTSESFAVNAKYPLLLKIAVPAAVVVGVIVLLKGGGDDGPLPVPPEPN